MGEYHSSYQREWHNILSTEEEVYLWSLFFLGGV